jgi:putative serine protease PepD
MLIPDKLWSAGDPPREAPRTAPHAAPPDPPAPDSGRPPGGRGRRRAVAAVAVAAALGAGGGVLALASGDEGGGPAPLPASASTLPGLGDNRNDVREIYRAASPAVVSVRAEGSGGEGTGFLVDRDGTIVTNAHVAGDSERAQVSFGDDGRTVAARVLGSDPSSDIAVLRVDAGAVAGVRPLPLADSDSVQVGDAAVAIGNPFGLDRTATAGIVSALEREITAPNGFSIEDVIQTDAPINPGNSGGPLLNARGQVIGVNSQIQSGGLRGNVGIGFAVPSNTVREVLPRLQQGETIERAWLGVSSAPDAGGDGARVQELTAGSPAQRAGLRAGDVIVSVDGRAVAEPSDIAAAIEDRQPGDSVRIEVLRGGERESLTVDLGTRPANTTP